MSSINPKITCHKLVIDSLVKECNKRRGSSDQGDQLPLKLK